MEEEANVIPNDDFNFEDCFVVPAREECVILHVVCMLNVVIVTEFVGNGL